jgi:hypothetical protein
MKLISSCRSSKSPNLRSYILSCSGSQKIPIVYETRRSLFEYKSVVTGSYPQPLQSNQHTIYLRSTFRLFSSQCLGLPNSLCPSTFPTKVLSGFFIVFIRVTCKPMYWILDCHNDGHEELDLLGCNVVRSGRSPPTFRKNLWPPSLE